MVHVGGALVCVWAIGWCLEVWRIKHWRCTSVHLEVVSVDLNVSSP